MMVSVPIINISNQEEGKELFDPTPIYNLAFESIQTDSINAKKISESKVADSYQDSESFYLPQHRDERRNTAIFYRIIE